jgi:hypothetical protein
MSAQDNDCAGFCRDCGCEHALAAGPALLHAQELMAALELRGSIDTYTRADPRLSLSYLFGPSRGQMFGVLPYRDASGQVGVLKAFSGQYNGIWDVPGWVPPILDPAEFAQTIERDEPRIKDLTLRMHGLGTDDPARLAMLAAAARIVPQSHGSHLRPVSADQFSRADQSPGRGLHGPGHAHGHGGVLRAQAVAPCGRARFDPAGTCGILFRPREPLRHPRHGQFFAPCAEKCRPFWVFCSAGWTRTSVTEVSGQLGAGRLAQIRPQAMSQPSGSSRPALLVRRSCGILLR